MEFCSFTKRTANNKDCIRKKIKQNTNPVLTLGCGKMWPDVANKIN